LTAIRLDLSSMDARVSAVHERVIGGATDGKRPLMIRMEDAEGRLDAIEEAHRREAAANLVDKRSAGVDAMRWIVVSAVGALITGGAGALIAWLMMRGGG